MHENAISGEIVDAAYRIHSSLGPGLLESAYETLLTYELMKRGLKLSRQELIPIRYGEIELDSGFRADLIVEGKVIVEIKSVEAVARVHEKQLLTYLKLANKRVGLLINFNVALLKDGICRVVNEFEDHGRAEPQSPQS